MNVSYKDEYTPEQKKRLLGIARQALTDHLSNREPTNPTIDPQHDKYLIVPCHKKLYVENKRYRGC